MIQAADAKDEPILERDAAVAASPAAARADEGTPAKKAAAELIAAADLSSVPPKTSGKSFLIAGLVLSTLLHVGMFVYLQFRTVENVGSGGVRLEGVTVDLVPLSALRAGAPNQPPDLGTDAAEEPKKEKTLAARRDETGTPPPEALIKPTDGTSELAAADITKPDPVNEDRDEHADKEKPNKPREPDTSDNDDGRAKRVQEARDAKFIGGASAAATPGQMSGYALSIREVLARHRPRHTGTRGRAIVEFWLTDTGTVQRAQIAQSSGTKLLDDAILAAIWKIQFPAPPEGIPDKDRGFTVPFEFR
ncbi:MAG: energy transducer TonB [Hyphomicrobiaceae bacterium]